MSAVAEVLEEVARRGMVIRVVSGNLHLGPKEQVTWELIAGLHEHKTDLVREIRLAALDEGERYLWEERVAICVFDGCLSEEDAEAIAWRQIDGMRVTDEGKDSKGTGGNN